jgi:hypothetical protein
MKRAHFGYSEPLRRFIQHEGFTPQVNEIRNQMPSWIPGEDHLINFQKGDPYVKVDEGYARLPGAGYEALHPELEGLDPEDYPDITKLSILGDVAPYSREYNRFRAIVEKQSHGDTDLRAQYEQIVEQVRQTKESTLQVDQRRFDAPVDEIQGTVKTASFRGIELAEYPGRTFHFSSVGSSMADIVADLLGQSNSMTRAEASRVADNRLRERDQYLSTALSQGTSVKLTVGRGAADNSQNVRAVIEAGGININRELIDQGYGRFRKDLGGAEEQAMHGGVARALGSYAEALSFEGDNSRWNPLRYLPGQVQTWSLPTPHINHPRARARTASPTPPEIALPDLLLKVSSGGSSARKSPCPTPQKLVRFRGSKSCTTFYIDSSGKGCFPHFHWHFHDKFRTQDSKKPRSSIGSFPKTTNFGVEKYSDLALSCHYFPPSSIPPPHT